MSLAGRSWMAWGAMALALTACRTPRVPPTAPPLVAKSRMPNPIRTGAVTPVPVVVSTTEEHVYSLPNGSLDKEGRIESVDDAHACFVVTLREMGPRVKWVDAREWKVSLVVDETKRIAAYKPTRLSEKDAAAMGRTIRVERVGQSFQCAHWDSTGACDRRALLPETAVASQNAEIAMKDATTRLCFETGGAITAATTNVALEFLAPPGRETPESFRMVWDFD